MKHFMQTIQDIFIAASPLDDEGRLKQEVKRDGTETDIPEAAEAVAGPGTADKTGSGKGESVGQSMD
jgi:hypothetical protein